MGKIIESILLNTSLQRSVFKRPIPRIKDLSFSINEKELVSFVGESLVDLESLYELILLTSDHPYIIDSGQLFINDFSGAEPKMVFNYKGHKNKGIDKGLINVVSSSEKTFSSRLSVGDELVKKFVTFNKGISIAKAKKEVIELIKLLGTKYPFTFFNAKFTDLTLLEQSNVLAIDTIVTKPKIIVLKKPLQGLTFRDRNARKEFWKIVVQKYNIAIITFTDNLFEAVEMTDVINIFYLGRIVEFGKSEEIINYPQHPFTWALVAAYSFSNSKQENSFSYEDYTYNDNLINFRGDHFTATRLKEYSQELDTQKTPPMFEVSPTHQAATWLLGCDSFLYAPPRIIINRWNKYIQKFGIKNIPGTKSWKEFAKCDPVQVSQSKQREIDPNSQIIVSPFLDRTVKNFIFSEPNVQIHKFAQFIKERYDAIEDEKSTELIPESVLSTNELNLSESFGDQVTTPNREKSVFEFFPEGYQKTPEDRAKAVTGIPKAQIEEQVIFVFSPLIPTSDDLQKLDKPMEIAGGSIVLTSSNVDVNEKAKEEISSSNLSSQIDWTKFTSLLSAENSIKEPLVIFEKLEEFDKKAIKIFYPELSAKSEFTGVWHNYIDDTPPIALDENENLVLKADLNNKMQPSEIPTMSTSDITQQVKEVDSIETNPKVGPTILGLRIPKAQGDLAEDESIFNSETTDIEFRPQNLPEGNILKTTEMELVLSKFKTDEPISDAKEELTELSNFYEKSDLDFPNKSSSLKDLKVDIESTLANQPATNEDLYDILEESVVHTPMASTTTTLHMPAKDELALVANQIPNSIQTNEAIDFSDEEQQNHFFQNDLIVETKPLDIKLDKVVQDNAIPATFLREDFDDKKFDLNLPSNVPEVVLDNKKKLLEDDSEENYEFIITIDEENQKIKTDILEANSLIKDVDASQTSYPTSNKEDTIAVVSPHKPKAIGRPRKIQTEEELNRPKRPRGRPRKVLTTLEINLPKRGRGRPRKILVTIELEKPKRGRGRPRKILNTQEVKRFQSTRGRGRPRKLILTSEINVPKRPRGRPRKDQQVIVKPIVPFFTPNEVKLPKTKTFSPKLKIWKNKRPFKNKG